MKESDEDKPRRKPTTSVDAPSTAVSRELDENEIDAPSKQTLVMLGVISLTTLILWGAGRAACNYEVPGESLTPRPVSFEDRTRTAKDVGFEFAHDVSVGDFDSALKIAKGDALTWVKQQKNACGDCDERKSARKRIFSTAAILKANSIDSLVKVHTIGGPGGDVIRFLGIEREGRKWRVTRIFKDAESAKLKIPPPSETPELRPDAPDDALHGALVPAVGEGDPVAENEPGATQGPSEPIPPVARAVAAPAPAAVPAPVVAPAPVAAPAPAAVAAPAPAPAP